MQEKITVAFTEEPEENIPLQHKSANIETAAEPDIENQSTPERHALVELTPDTWQKYKEARLRSKETDPQAFGTNVMAETGETGEAYWRDKLNDPNIRMFAIEIDGKIAAMAGLQKKNDGRFLLRRVYTTPEMRGKGFGKVLIERIFAEAKSSGAKSIELDVAEGQDSAIGLYQKLGFEEFKRKDATKGDGKVHTEIFMRKILQ